MAGERDVLVEALQSALAEFDNVRWDDIWAGLIAAGKDELAAFSMSYVGYVRDDIERALAAATPPEPAREALDDAIATLEHIRDDAQHRLAALSEPREPAP